MGRMIRKQIYIEPEQDQVLKREAKRLGVSEAEVIRRKLGNGDVEESERLAAWVQAKRFMEERMKMRVPQRPRSWTRDELYEDRLARFSRR